MALTAVTRPPYGLLSLVKSVGEAVPLGVVVVTSALNYWIFGPRTVKDAFARREISGMISVFL